MKRFFTFGCSFTDYHWPTWADIMSLEYDHYQNWGRNGGGNHFIFYSLIEAISRENINSQDTVAIMWTSVGREDRWIRNGWFLSGSIYYSQYPKEYVDKFTDPTGFFLTNLTVIDAVKKLLDNIGCRYYFFSVLPFEKIDDSILNRIFPLENKVELQVKDLYKDTLNKIQPSVFEMIFNKNWNSRDFVIIPTAQKQKTSEFKKRYLECAGADWPSFEDFMEGNIENIHASIILEIEDQFQFMSWRQKILTTRQDSHPTPSEHAEYLEKLGFDLTADQIEYARIWNDKVLSSDNIKFEKNKVDRF